MWSFFRRRPGSSSGSCAATNSESLKGKGSMNVATLIAPGRSTAKVSRQVLLPSSLPETKLLVAEAALNKLFTEDSFSICRVDELMKITGGQKNAAYHLLRPLHCIPWGDMRPELREKIPDLVAEALKPLVPTQDVANQVMAQVFGCQAER